MQLHSNLFYFILFIKIFLIWTILNVFIEFATILFLLYAFVFWLFLFFFFAAKACELLAPRPGTESMPTSIGR